MSITDSIHHLYLLLTNSRTVLATGVLPSNPAYQEWGYRSNKTSTSRSKFLNLDQEARPVIPWPSMRRCDVSLMKCGSKLLTSITWLIFLIYFTKKLMDFFRLEIFQDSWPGYLCKTVVNSTNMTQGQN